MRFDRNPRYPPSRTPVVECTEEECSEAAAVCLHIPWAENRVFCTGHVRAYAQKDGIVADPLESADEEPT